MKKLSNCITVLKGYSMHYRACCKHCWKMFAYSTNCLLYSVPFTIKVLFIRKYTMYYCINIHNSLSTFLCFCADTDLVVLFSVPIVDRSYECLSQLCLQIKT